jgi:hypothetical protein
MPHASQWLIRAGAAFLVIAYASGVPAQTTKPVAGSPSPPSSGSPSTGPSPQMQGRFAAPIGHRQPTRAEIPDSDRAQTHAGTGFDDLDAKLRICRGC